MVNLWSEQQTTSPSHCLYSFYPIDEPGIVGNVFNSPKRTLTRSFAVDARPSHDMDLLPVVSFHDSFPANLPVLEDHPESGDSLGGVEFTSATDSLCTAFPDSSKRKHPTSSAEILVLEEDRVQSVGNSKKHRALPEVEDDVGPARSAGRRHSIQNMVMDEYSNSSAINHLNKVTRLL